MLYADEVGLYSVVDSMKRFAANPHGDPAFWKPAPLLAKLASEGKKFNRSEEHTSELQSQSNLVCRLLLEKKKTKTNTYSTRTVNYLIGSIWIISILKASVSPSCRIVCAV